MSGYLDSGAVDKVRDMLGGDAGDVLSSPEQVTERPSAAQEAGKEDGDTTLPSSQTSTDEAAVVKEKASSEEVGAGSDSASSAEESGDSEASSLHRVPYTRFKEVVDARNGYKSELDSLRQEIERLKAGTAQQAQPSIPQQQYRSVQDMSDEELLAMLSDEGQSGHQEPWMQEMAQMRNRMHEYEVSQATVKLENDLSVAQQKYPVVPREALLQAVINDDSANIMEVAEQYSSFIVSIEEAAIARHLAEGKSVSQAKAEAKEDVAQAVAPRPSKAASAPVNSPISAGDHKPKDLKDASKALRAFLKNNNPFV